MDNSKYDYNDLGAFGFKRKKSAKQYKQKSELLFKILLFFGIILLLGSIVLMVISITGISDAGTDYSNISNSVFSISIIILAFAVILYFFKRQFAKLADIAEEIENNIECSDEEIQ